METSDQGGENTVRVHAAERAAELKRRKVALETHQPFDPADVELAARRAREAHEWARKVEGAAAAAFATVADLHEEAARLHDLAVEHGHGDLPAHRDAAHRHREAAQANRAKAERKRREAANE